MKKKHIEVDESVHKQLKAQAAKHGLSLKDYMAKLADQHETD